MCCFSTVQVAIWLDWKDKDQCRIHKGKSKYTTADYSRVNGFWLDIKSVFAG